MKPEIRNPMEKEIGQALTPLLPFLREGRSLNQKEKMKIQIRKYLNHPFLNQNDKKTNLDNKIANI